MALTLRDLVKRDIERGERRRGALKPHEPSKQMKELVYSWGYSHTPIKTVCSALDISYGVFQKYYLLIYLQGKADAAHKINLKLIERALDGESSTLIHASKTIGGLNEKVEVDVSVNERYVPEWLENRKLARGYDTIDVDALALEQANTSVPAKSDGDYESPNTEKPRPQIHRKSERYAQQSASVRKAAKKRKALLDVLSKGVNAAEGEGDTLSTPPPSFSSDTPQ